MITKFEVSNYKSIKSLAVAMRPFMVLVGPNGSGKTNVVRALQLLGDLLSRGTTDPAREEGWGQIVHREQKPARGGLKLAATLLVPPMRGGPEVEARVSLSLRGKAGDHDVIVASEELRLTSNSKKSKLELKWANGKLETDLGDDPALWETLDFSRGGSNRQDLKARLDASFGRQGPLFQDKPISLRLLNLRLGPIFYTINQLFAIVRLRLDASALRSDARFQADGDNVLGPSGEGLPVAVDRLRGRKDEPAPQFRPILDALREVYPRIEDVVPEAFAQGRVTLGFRERGIAEPIPLDGVSDGVLHALALLIALQQRQPGILAIEEPENALHPWSVRKIMAQAQTARTGQVLITTHSETVVNAVLDPESLFIVESDDQGTTVEPATSKEKALATILNQTGQKLGDIWIDGSLGGVPLR